MIKKKIFLNFSNLLLTITLLLIFTHKINAAESDVYIVKDENRLKPITIKNQEVEKKAKVDFSLNIFNDGKNGRKISWKPRWQTYGSASLALIDTSFAIDDQLVFVERAGKNNRPTGALIVIYNYKNDEFKKIIKVLNHEIKSFKVDKKNNLLYAITNPQKCFNQKKQKVIAINLDDGKIIAEQSLKEPKDKILGLAILDNNVFVSFYNEYDEKINIDIYDTFLKNKKKTLNTTFSEGFIVPLKTKSKVALLSREGGIIIDKKLVINKKFNLSYNLTTKISEAVYCISKNRFILMTEQGMLLSIDNDSSSKKKIISNSVSSSFSYNQKNESLSFFDSRKKRLKAVDGNDDFEDKISLSVTSLKPRSPRGSIVKWSKVINNNPFEFLVFTSYGELYTITYNKKRRRGVKQVIFTAVQ